MALALDDLLDSFGSSSFAVHPQPEKDLRASLQAAFNFPAPSSSPSYHPSSPSAPRRIPIADPGMSRGGYGDWSPAGNHQGSWGSNGASSNSSYGGASRGPAPPNTPMGTPLRADGFPPSFSVQSSVASGPSSVSMAVAGPSLSSPAVFASDPPSNPHLFAVHNAAILSPPPSPVPPEHHHSSSASPLPTPSCAACAYAATLDAAAPKSSYPLPAQHAQHCPISRQAVGTGTMAWPHALPSPSPSPSPGRSPAGGETVHAVVGMR